MPTRRTFLQILGVTTAVAACGNGNNGGSGEATGDIAAGNTSSLSVGTLRVVSGQPVVIARDAQGLYAMSTICTHAQCDMRSDGSISSSGMRCDCHGSVFDAEGRPTGGPAGSAVSHYAVEVSASGDITVHAGTKVSVSTRVAVTG